MINLILNYKYKSIDLKLNGLLWISCCILVLLIWIFIQCTQYKKLFILIAIPCLGKSTYAKRFLYNSNVIIISSDNIRKESMRHY